MTGDATRAIDWLRRSIDVSTIPAQFFASPALESLRSDARFVALRRASLERVNEERAKLDLAPLTEAYCARD